MNGLYEGKGGFAHRVGPTSPYHSHSRHLLKIYCQICARSVGLEGRYRFEELVNLHGSEAQ